MQRRERASTPWGGSTGDCRRTEKISTLVEVLPESEAQARRLALSRGRFDLIEGTLCYVETKSPHRIRVAVPKQLRSLLMEETHSGRISGHFTEKCLAKIYWWDGMKDDVRRHCRTCLPCLSRDRTGRRLHPKLCVGGPFEGVEVDVLTLPQTEETNRFAVVFVDYLTNWPEVFATPDHRAETIAGLLVEHVVCRHGAPKELL